jgi:hypothetical protein
MFNDATAYMLGDDKLMKQLYRIKALEKLDESVEAFISWFELTSKVCVLHSLGPDGMPSYGLFSTKFLFCLAGGGGGREIH